MEDKTEKFIKSAKRVSFIVVIFLFILFLAAAGIFTLNLAPVDTSDKKVILFTIPEGTSVSEAISLLDQKGLIKSKTFLKLYAKFANNHDVYAGNYELSKNLSSIEILRKITNSKDILADDITLTFVEGKKLTDYVKIISDNFKLDKNDILNKMSDRVFLEKVIEKYWFIDDSILDSNLYYPLEGYLFPDTYSFSKESDIEKIITTMLDGLELKLDKYKDKIQNNNLNVHSLLTLASVVELEAVSASDRLMVAGVFNNRINNNIALGSDVTTYYAVKKELSESLSMNELNLCNAYNTRGTCAIAGLPIGPICSPSVSSIVAAISPSVTDYYYFVADKNNKLYFGKNSSDHLNNINKLKNDGLWPE